MARWRVRIPYVEPTFAARQARPPAEPFVAEVEVEADSDLDAVERGLEKFEGDARDSGVGWIREPLEGQVVATRVA